MMVVPIAFPRHRADILGGDPTSALTAAASLEYFLVFFKKRAVGA